MSAAIQRERVLLALRQRGHNGITLVDFSAPAVCDGAKPIPRLAARVRDLRVRGHVITTEMRETPDGARMALYRLEREAPTAPAVPPAPAPSAPSATEPPADGAPPLDAPMPGSLQLFDLDAVPPAAPVRASHYAFEEAL